MRIIAGCLLGRLLLCKRASDYEMLEFERIKELDPS